MLKHCIMNFHNHLEDTKGSAPFTNPNGEKTNAHRERYLFLKNDFACHENNQDPGFNGRLYFNIDL